MAWPRSWSKVNSLSLASDVLNYPPNTVWLCSVIPFITHLLSAHVCWPFAKPQAVRCEEEEEERKPQQVCHPGPTELTMLLKVMVFVHSPGEYLVDTCVRPFKDCWNPPLPWAPFQPTTRRMKLSFNKETLLLPEPIGTLPVFRITCVL